MPNWQAELEQLLASLHVTMDRGIATQPAHRSPRIDDEPGMPDEFDPALAPELPGEEEDSSAADEEVAAVRNEIEATVRRVVAMTDAGTLEASVRDDVLFVLQALTRPQPRRQWPRQPSAADSSGEWQLTSAAAVLHFCRIVLRLTRAVESDDC